MLAGLPVAAPAVQELVTLVRQTGGHDLADRLEQAVEDDVTILALTIDERAVILNVLDDPPDGLAELRAVLINEHQWREHEGLGQRQLVSILR